MTQYFPQGELVEEVKKSERFSPGNDFLDQIFTGELSGAIQAGYWHRKFLVRH